MSFVAVETDLEGDQTCRKGAASMALCVLRPYLRRDLLKELNAFNA